MGHDAAYIYRLRAVSHQFVKIKESKAMCRYVAGAIIQTFAI